MKIVITGGRGQLAQALVHHPLAKNHHLIVLNKEEADLTQAESLFATLNHHQPDVIVNAAAYTAVDLAETEQEKAYAVNAIGPQLLAQYCHDHRRRLIHVSTDYVFDGNTHHPYHEEGSVHPVNYYGVTKAEGEENIRAILKQHIILRVSGVFSEYGKNFLKTMLMLAKEREYLSIVTDQTTCPTDAHAIAGALFAIVDQPKPQGTYHFCGKLAVTWHHFAASIFGAAIANHNAHFKLHTMKRITSADYPTPAKRPAYSVLNCEKIFRDFGITQPPLQASIDRVLAILMKESTP